MCVCIHQCVYVYTCTHPFSFNEAFLLDPLCLLLLMLQLPTHLTALIVQLVRLSVRGEGCREGTATGSGT